MVKARIKSICTISVHSGCVTKPWAANGAQSITKNTRRLFHARVMLPQSIFIFYGASGHRLLADNEVVEVGALLDLLLDLADDGAEVLSVLLD